jgi:uncharacterized ParB-like nuclease family protein
MIDKRMRPIRLIPIRLIEPWRCATPPGWREYAAMMRAGDEFPPVQVIRQSSKLHGYPYRLFDGYHRTRAAKHIGRRTIAAHVISDETMTWVEMKAAARSKNTRRLVELGLKVKGAKPIR